MRTCLNCNSPNIDKYCSECGQKQNYSYASKAFLVDVMHDYLGFDGKIIRTLKSIATSPGKLTKDHFDGKRVRYVKPFQLFLFVNVLFVFLAVSRGVYDFTLLEYRKYTPPDTKLVQSMVSKSLKDQGISYEAYEKEFNANSDFIRKWLIFLLVPLFALISWLFQFNHQKEFTAHLIFSMHFFTFYWLYVTFVSPFLTIPLGKLGFYVDNIMKYINPSVNAIYIYLSLARIQTEHKLWSLSKAIIFAFSIHYLLLSYRILLFFTSYYLT